MVYTMEDPNRYILHGATVHTFKDFYILHTGTVKLYQLIILTVYTHSSHVHIAKC